MFAGYLLGLGATRQRWAALLVGASWLISPCLCHGDDAEPAVSGREIFLRQWIPHDPRSHKGDGLGPVFNDSSCAACHNQGGPGGAGPIAKNAQIVSAFRGDVQTQAAPETSSVVGSVVSSFFHSAGRPRPAAKLSEKEQQAEIRRQRERLTKIHPGFGASRSVVLHRFSTEPAYERFRRRFANGTAEVLLTEPAMAPPSAVAIDSTLGVQQSVDTGEFTFIVSERNTTSLFGGGLIDGIPDEVMLAAAQQRYAEFPEISGRVARLKDGRLGRFGWKAQKSRLGDFVLTACAVELGLNVPSEPQSGTPLKPDYQPPGLDLNEAECVELISFIAKLPAPQELATTSEAEREYREGGRKLFASAGCASCHTPKLGDVAGIYSDLLLHDMGQNLSDSGSYGGFVPNSTEEEELNQPLPALVGAPNAEKAKPVDESKLVGALRQEWRTPPLWGVRDSAPYLHDGRAATIEEAVGMHGGEAVASVQKFFSLKPAERLQVTLFLNSLTAPD